MGQARNQGDFLARQAAAIARNDALAKQIESLPETAPIRQAAKRMPMQRLAVGLMMVGLLSQEK